jgi:hypothetical protein
MCSAARANSRLHQAAIEALTSITVDTSKQREKRGQRDTRDDLLHSLVDLYLIRHGQYVDSISLNAGHNRALAALPTTLTKLTSLTMQVGSEKGCECHYPSSICMPLEHMHAKPSSKGVKPRRSYGITVLSGVLIYSVLSLCRP